MLNFHTSLSNFRSHINDLKLSPQEFNKKKLCDRKCDRKRMSKNKEKIYTLQEKIIIAIYKS